MTRRRVISLAIAVSLLAMPIGGNSASASISAEAIEREPIARKLVTSPQTTGPTRLSAPYNRLPWGLDRIDQRSNTLDQSYSFTKTGAGVKVYVVDSGVNAAHTEAFSNRVVDGWSYRSNAQALMSYGAQIDAGNISACPYNPLIHQVDTATFDRPDAVDVTDKGKLGNDGHGTHVAGIVGGEYTGVAKDVTIVPVRVLDSCGVGTSTMVRLGLDWILANHADGEPAVVNMSIGFDASAFSIDERIRLLLAEGVVVVAAAGNSSTTACNSTPAGTVGTISVGAIDSSFKESSYSNYGACVDIFAPGSTIISSWPKYGSSLNTYLLETGTSMAAPFVAGAAALYLQGKSATTETPWEVWTWLRSNSTCDAVTYFDTKTRSASAQTVNRLLNIGSTPGVPCRPASASAVAGNLSAVVSWTEPSGTNGSPITSYTATATPGGASCSSPSLMTCTLTGLTNNTTYSISISAVNSVGASAPAATTVTPVGPPVAVINAAASVADQAVTVSWSQPPGDGTGINYLVAASPGGATCSTTTTSCTITGLINSQPYSFSIIGTNQYGTAPSVTVSAIPDGPPAVPTVVKPTVGSRTLTVAWPAVTTTANVTYVATANPGRITCITTQTSCSFVGLTNGVDYTINISTISPSGFVTKSSLNYVARPGFTILKTLVKRNSKTTLTTIVKSVSPGRRTWSETGPCTIRNGKFVASKTKGTCKLRLRVAKSGSFPAMSTVIVIKVY